MYQLSISISSDALAENSTKVLGTKTFSLKKLAPEYDFQGCFKGAIFLSKFLAGLSVYISGLRTGTFPLIVIQKSEGGMGMAKQMVGCPWHF